MQRDLIPDSGFFFRTFTANWPLLTSVTKAELLAEFNAARGGAGTFQFITPTSMGGETLNCRFISSSLSIDRTGNRSWSASAQFEVVRMVF